MIALDFCRVARSYFRPVICTHCGCENPNGIAYCRDCGMSLRAAPPRVAAPTPTPELAAASGLLGPQASNLAATQIASRDPAPLPVAAAPPAEAPNEPSRVGEVPCPRCSERSPEGSRFCHSCGCPLPAKSTAAVPRPTPQQGPLAVPKLVANGPPPSMLAPALVNAPPPVAAAPAAYEDLSSPFVSAPPRASVACPRCRGAAEPGADFCKFCGARLAPEVRSDAPRAEASTASATSTGSATIAPAGANVTSIESSGEKRSGLEAEASLTRPLHGVGEPTVHGRLVRIAKDGSEGAHHVLVSEVTDIGRSEGAILLADDPYLSGRHARLALRPGSDPAARPTLVLIDLGSVNGIFVRLRAPHPLAHGDLLLLGQQVLRFEAVTEIEGARGPAMQHGVLLFGSPAPATRARLVQRTVEGLARDLLYLVRDEFVLGRESGDRTYPEDVFMSRRHAAIRREGSGFVLHDLGSSNGTFVQIQGEHPLQDGDQFRIGHHLFRVDLPTPDGAA